MNRCLFIVAFIIASLVLSRGQGCHMRVSGRVIDNKGPVEAVMIGVWSDSVLITGGVSDYAGAFLLQNLPQGKYQIKFNRAGYDSVSVSIELTDRDIRVDDVFLTEAPIALGEVMVTAKRPIVAVEPGRITYSVKSDPIAKGSNLQQVFERIPLVTPSAGGFLIRGHMPPTYLINGRPAALFASDVKTALNSIPANTVKEIQIITHPGAKYPGDHAGGIINIITENKLTDALSGSVRLTIDDQRRTSGMLSLGAKVRQFSITTSYTRSIQRSYFESWLSRRIYPMPNARIVSIEKERTYTRNNSHFFILESSWTPSMENTFHMGVSYVQLDTQGDGPQRMIISQGANTPPSSYLLTQEYTDTRYSNLDLALSYQRKIGHFGELMFMYKYTDLPKEGEDVFLTQEAANYISSDIHSVQSTHSREHTAEMDLTRHFGERHTLNAGMKYIVRKNTNKSRLMTRADSTWLYTPDAGDNFSHIQKVLACYAEYILSVSQWRGRIGIRDEWTFGRVTFAASLEDDVKTGFNDVLPFAELSFDARTKGRVTLSYSNRIARPSIRHLNPKLTYTDPWSVSFGNPSIKSQMLHAVELEYGVRGSKYMADISSIYTFSNDAILAYYGQRNENLVFQSFTNGGNYRKLSLSGYYSYSPTSWLQASINVGVHHTFYAGFDRQGRITNNGWSGNTSLYISATVPYDYRITLGGSYTSPPVTLQGRGFAFYHSQIGATKNFLNDRLTVSLSVRDMFWNRKQFSNHYYTSNFDSRLVYYNPGCTFELSVNFLLNKQLIRVQRMSKRIRNTDVLSTPNN